MTEKANPSPNRPADAFSTAGAIAYGGSVDGFIVDGTNPTDISTQDSDIDETALNTFEETTSTTSLTVNIDPGEGFVFGSWLAVDTQTSVTLDASTSAQTVYLGWNKDTSNDVIIGKDSSFSTVQSDTDQRIALYEFDTDSSGVTSTTDRRQIGRAQDLAALSVADQLGVPVYADSATAPQTEGNVVVVDGSGSQTAGIYSHNGTSYTKAGKTEQAIEDIVAGLINSGTDINVNYDDANDTLTINNTAGYTDEEAQDAVATALVGGANISTVYDDPNDEITIDTSALDAEGVQDEVNSLLTSNSNINLTYDDANNSLTVSLSSTVSASTVDIGSELGAPVYQSTSDVPNVPEGTVVYIQDNNSLYVEDGT
jgi:hypothetical protein